MRRSVVPLLFIALVASCSQGQLGPSPSGAGGATGSASATKASFILANPGGLLALDETCRSTGRIVDLPAQSFPATPTLHPNGRTMAFALTQLPDKQRGFGSDLYAVNLDGSDLHPLVLHENDNVFYASPRYDSTGNLLYFHRRAAIVQNGQYIGNDDSIVRLDLRTGERRTLLKDGADPTLSPDGRRLVYIHIVNGQVDTIWTAGVDGADAKPFLAGKHSFYYLQAPRFSPKGDLVVFSAAGHSTSLVPGRTPHMAHLGVPSEIFVAPADGSSLRAIGQTGDDIVPAWSPDGARLAYVATGAFFVLTLATDDIKTCATGQDFFFGDLLYLK